MDLKGKWILLTGGKRIGQVVADVLGGAGANIIMTYRKSRKEISQAVEHLQKIHGIQATTLPVDMSDERSIRGLFHGVLKHVGPLHGLVNMASVFQEDPKELTFKEFGDLYAINAHGGTLLSELFAEDAASRKAKNLPIVSFIDWAVEHPYRNHVAYLGSKAAFRASLIGIMMSHPGRVRVVNILPGMIQEPPGFSAAEKKAIIANTPTQSIGDPQQAAELVRVACTLDYLATDIYLDGGQHWRHRLAA
jgi:NAD(P)-dependent dehydrogenase (short-subunit alcohol dehydrogenase family)